MAIRIDCTAPGYEECWIEYREESWPFKDRRRILSSVSDIETLEIILGYITAWNLKDVDGKEVPFVPSIDSLDNVDDTRLVSWIVASWFMARAERSALPKAPSKP